MEQKTVGLDWSNTSLTYTGSAQAPTATATGTVNSDAVSVTVTGAQTDAGTGYTATATGLTGDKAGNYVLPDGKTTTFAMEQANVTVTANAQSVEVGGSIATGPAQATLTGAVDGHTLSAVTLTASATTAVTTAGTITPSAPMDSR